MNREILFRGKSKKSGKWAIGSLITNQYQAFIVTHDTAETIEVDESSVGQFTGDKDKVSSNMVFDGDICVATFRTSRGIEELRGNIYWDEYMWMLGTDDDYYSLNRVVIVNVTGNVYENPELLNP